MTDEVYDMSLMKNRDCCVETPVVFLAREWLRLAKESDVDGPLEAVELFKSFEDALLRYARVISVTEILLFDHGISKTVYRAVKFLCDGFPAATV